jgi:tRNA1Val (adenine37-N6)-methyltransferase
MKPKSNETLDSIKDIKLFQAKKGYRFSIDAILLENFIALKQRDKGIELGTGSGVISILLAKRLRTVRITAVEIQKSMADRAKRNVKLNGLDERVEVLKEDIKLLKDMYPTNTFDFVLSNPPFREPATGRMSLDDERAVARHEIDISLPDLIDSASYLLKHSGRFYLIYHPFRLVELIELLRKKRLEPKRMRFVHSRPGEEAKMVLIEAMKGSGKWLKVDPPLCIHEKGSKYTKEMNRVLGRGK